MARSSDGREIPQSVRALVQSVCDIAGSKTLIDDARVELAAAGVIEAVTRRSDAVIFDWLMDALSYQGISNAVAYSYIEEHERISSLDIAKALDSGPSCPKLRGYHTFFDCRYRKWEDSCAEPKHKAKCSLPRHDLRNGRLNQTAYSLFMFLRDVAVGDFVGWIDYQLRPKRPINLGGASMVLTSPVVGPMTHIYGVSSKVLNMAMASLLLAGDAKRPDWIAAGAKMIAVDSLVHNWLHRTGILKRIGIEHLYGAGCYQESGCAALLEKLAGVIDARTYNRGYPKVFPRFVQFAIWRFCSQGELDVCNGNQIDDFDRCQNRSCELYRHCAKRQLHDRPRIVPDRLSAARGPKPRR